MIITCTVTDPEGNEEKCKFRLKVWDGLDPEIFCPDDMTVECDTEGGAFVEYEVTTDDLCCPDLVDLVCEPPSGSFFPIGTTVVTCTATDWDNNSAECSFTITVEDTTGPEIFCPDDITVSCETSDGAVVEYEVTAQDLCDETVILECEPPSGSLFPVGTTTVTCTAHDGSGNMTTCEFDVTVTDDPPTITCPDDITVECEGPDGAVVDYEVTAEDDCDPEVDIVCTPPVGKRLPHRDHHRHLHCHR